MNLKFLENDAEKRVWLRKASSSSPWESSGNRRSKPVWQGFGFRGYEEAVIRWSQPKFEDSDLDQALGWSIPAKRGRIGQVAELRQFVGIETDALSNKAAYVERGTLQLPEHWKKEFSVDLLLVVSRDIGFGVGGDTLSQLGWERIGLFQKGGLWAKELVPNAKELLCNLPETPEVPRKSVLRLPPWVASLAPQDLEELRTTISRGIDDARPRKGRHYGMGPMIALLWLAYRCGHEEGARQARWLEALDVTSQRALGFSRVNRRGGPLLPSARVINEFYEMLHDPEKYSDTDLFVLDDRFNNWARKHGVPAR